ncbi:ABC-2 type transport system ATP-binding protein [Actinopolyspora alba]|uniref:ABC-2 type transport system ATP-binding protein n=1 Tax=Actinopolyspora alba TaxID=673379 RepID=A0A1I1TP76_9ACTN|nr:ATP-binding cassette domain-containing protein [Actinopolyspora alba]SFD60314.1 ABC-2 type transport system ATP-binding protein [Actinopolyspora alba]
MDNVIQAEGLRKNYGDRLAVRSVDLSVPGGSVLGVLGPNGAGKTTLVRMLATLLDVDGGHAEVAGYDVTRHPRKVRERIGLTGQYAAVDSRLTARENLRLIGRLHHLDRFAAERRGEELLRRFDLLDAADRYVGTYSGGMRRRVDLAASLIGEPMVLFLDEPTTGLDPASRQVLWDSITEQVEAGTSVLLTTQYLEEADRLADRVVVIDEGSVAAEGKPAELKSRVGGERLRVVVRERSELPGAISALAPIAPEEPDVDTATGEVSIELRNGVESLAQAAEALRGAGVEPDEFGLYRPSLDDVFLSLIGDRTVTEQSALGKART